MKDEPIYIFYKEDESNVIWSVDVDPPMKHGSLLFSFDKKTIYSFFRDYPHELSDGQRAIFDAEFPSWADYYKSNT